MSHRRLFASSGKAPTGYWIDTNNPTLTPSGCSAIVPLTDGGAVFLQGDGNGSNINLITRVDTNGTIVWHGFFGYSYLMDLCVDPSNNIYVVGRESGTDTASCFVAKLAYGTGAISWSYLYGNNDITAGVVAACVCYAPNGNLYVGGYLQAGVYVTGVTDAFVMSIAASTGTFQARCHFRGSTTADNCDEIYSITSDSSSNIYATGSSSYAIILKFGPTLASAPTGYRSNTVASTAGLGVCVDSSNNIYYVSGDSTVTKFNSSFVQQWSRSVGAAACVSTDISVDSTGNVYILTDDTNAYTPDTRITKLNSSGTYQWSKAFLSTGNTISIEGSNNGINVNSNGIYVAGYAFGPPYYAWVFAKFPLTISNVSVPGVSVLDASTLGYAYANTVTMTFTATNSVLANTFTISGGQTDSTSSSYGVYTITQYSPIVNIV